MNPWPPRYRCDALPSELWSLPRSSSGVSSIYTRAKITFSVVLYLQFTHMIFIIYTSHLERSWQDLEQNLILGKILWLSLKILLRSYQDLAENILYKSCTILSESCKILPKSYQNLAKKIQHKRKMPKPFSNGLRWLVVWLKLFLNKSDVVVATALWLIPQTVNIIYTPYSFKRATWNQRLWENNWYHNTQLANLGHKSVCKFWFCKLALTCLKLQANYFKSQNRMAFLSSNSSVSPSIWFSSWSSLHVNAPPKQLAKCVLKLLRYLFTNEELSESLLFVSNKSKWPEPWTVLG